MPVLSSIMLEAIHFQYFLGGLVSLLVITNPLSKLPLFVSLTQGMSEERRQLALAGDDVFFTGVGIAGAKTDHQKRFFHF